MRHKQRAARLSPGAAIAAAVIATLAVAGCGGGSKSRPNASAPPPAGAGPSSSPGTTPVPRGMSMSAPVSIASGQLAEVSSAVDPRTGRIYVVYSTALKREVPAGWGPAGDPYVTWSDDGGRSFAPPVRVSPVSGEDFSGSPVNIGVTPKGTVMLDWENNTPDRDTPDGEGQFAIRVARSTDGGRHWTVQTDPPDGGVQEVSRPDLYAPPNGQVWLMWLDGRPADRKSSDSLDTVDLSLSTDDGKSFSFSWPVKSNACQCCRPALALGPHGLLAMAWRQVLFPTGTPASGGSSGMGMDMSGMSSSQMKGMHMAPPSEVRDIEVATSPDDGQDFGLGVQPHVDNWKIDACPIIGPSLYYTPDGQKLVVTWFTGATGRAGVWTSSSSDNGASWSAPIRLTSSVVATGADIQSVPGTGGAGWAAWATPKAVQAALVASNGTVSETPALTGVIAGAAPAITPTKAGTLLFYIARSGGTDRLLVRRLGT